MSLKKAIAFVRAVEAWAPAEALAPLITSDFEQTEMPNPFNKHGAVRDLEAARESMRRGETLINDQRFDIERQLEAGDTVLLEMIWSGSLAVEVGRHPPGTPLRAKIAQVYEFRDGRIARLRTYDCYEPF